MKNFLAFACIVLICAPVALKAQTGGPVVFTVGKDTVYGAEFERVFSKNSKPDKGSPTTEELEEYLNLYIKFKLKVKEAYARGMDTNQAFIQELAGYRKQLAQPYLTDKEVTESLIREAYDRMKTEVRASHIMVRLSPDAGPKDTLIAWQRIMTLRDKIIKGGMAFDSVAYQFSEDESAKFNYGDLGFFTAFSMIYSFENMAYNSSIGAVSMPFRTSFGYHIILVKEKRENRGDVRTAHLMIRFNNESEIAAAKGRIETIYQKLQKGEDFNTLVQQFSEDFGTRSRNGELNWFNSTSSGIPLEIREAAFALKTPGDYTQPIKSEFGWHIIRLIEKKGLAPYDELKESIKFKVQKDQRSEKNKEVVLVRLKKDNAFTEIPGAVESFIQLADSGVLKSGWKPEDKLTKKNNQALFSIKGVAYTYADFIRFIQDQNAAKPGSLKDQVIRGYYNGFVSKMNFDWEEKNLEIKYDEFKFLMQEYRDGILLFELTDKMVWSKSVEDTVGLKAFFESNRTKYMWGERAELATYTCKDAKTASKVKKAIAKGSTADQILVKFNTKDPEMVKVSQKLIEKGEKGYTHLTWNTGIQDLPSLDQSVIFAHIAKIRQPEPKELYETLGLATTDYQTHLENIWIATLQEKYPVVVNPNALEQLFKK